jgi:hypothetical protein
LAEEIPKVVGKGEKLQPNMVVEVVTLLLEKHAHSSGRVATDLRLWLVSVQLRADTRYVIVRVFTTLILEDHRRSWCADFRVLYPSVFVRILVTVIELQTPGRFWWSLPHSAAQAVSSR